MGSVAWRATLVCAAAFTMAPACRDWDALDPRQGAGGGTTSATSSQATSVATTSSSAESGAGGHGGQGGQGGGVPYREVVLADHPIAYWRLGETPSDGTVHDETGTYPGHYGEPSADVPGVAGLIAGDPDTAVRFEPTCGHTIEDKIDVNVPDDAAHTLAFVGHSFSVEAWFGLECASDGVKFRRIIEKSDGTSGWSLVFDDELLAVGFHWQSGTTDTLRLCSAVAGNGTHHVVFTYDAGSQNYFCYVDGQASSGNVGTPLADTNYVIRIGSNSAHNYAFGGTLDEIALYSEVLPDDRVAAHFDAGKGL